MNPINPNIMKQSDVPMMLLTCEKTYIYIYIYIYIYNYKYIYIVVYIIVYV